MSEHPPGTIAVVSGDLSRYPNFTMSLLGLEAPPGTKPDWCAGLSTAEGRNVAIRRMSGEWIWFIDDDHPFAPDMLLRLLGREVDIIQPLVVQRKGEFKPTVYGRRTSGEYALWDLSNLPTRGLLGASHGVDAVGSGGMLIRKHVLDEVGDPWFEVGQMGSERLNSDVYFCHKARALGYQCFVDLDATMGHTGPATVWPRRTPDGHWKVEVDFSMAPPPPLAAMGGER